MSHTSLAAFEQLDNSGPVSVVVPKKDTRYVVIASELWLLISSRLMDSIPHGGELINGYHDVPVFEIDCSDSGFSEFGHYPNNYVCCIARNY